MCDCKLVYPTPYHHTWMHFTFHVVNLEGLLRTPQKLGCKSRCTCTSAFLLIPYLCTCSSGGNQGRDWHPFLLQALNNQVPQVSVCPGYKHLRIHGKPFVHTFVPNLSHSVPSLINPGLASTMYATVIMIKTTVTCK